MIETVIIVDDEVHVRKTLRKMIESNQTGWIVAAEASNGFEALEAIALWDPDLVITDVMMPLINGIELAESIYLQKKDTMVIILTGYKDFEYAQAALRFGVLDFLLKPCSEHDFCSVLIRLHGKLTEAKLERQIEERFLEETTIRALFYRLPYDRKTVERLQPKYEKSTLWLLRVNDFFPTGKTYNSSDLFIIQFAIGNIIQEMADSLYEYAYVVLIRYDRFAVFLGNKQAEAIDNGANALFKQIEDKVMDLLHIPVGFQFAGSVDRLDQLTVLKENAEPESVKYTDRRKEVSLPPTQEYTLNYTKLQSLESQWMSYIVLGQIDLLQQNLSNLQEKISELPLEDTRLEALAAAVTMNTIARKHLDVLSMTFDLEKEIESLHRFEQPEKVMAWLKTEVKSFLALLIDWAKSKSTNVMTKAIEYVDRFYMERCSLQEAAAHVYLNPKYFSLLFKKEMGQGFIHYVTKVRLEKAEMLLNNTNLRVTEIALAVGYDDPNYFSTVFRKEYGISPNEYRKNKA